MKKKVIIIITICMLFVACFCGVMFFHKQSTNIDTYVIYNEALYLGEAAYSQCEIDVEAVEIGNFIGKTSDGKQIFSIQGLQAEEYILMRQESEEKVFRNVRLNPFIDVNKLDFYKMIVRSDGSIEDAVEIDDKNVIKEMLNQIQDENIVNGEVVGEVFKDIVLYSGKYKGLCYKYSYVIDENKEEYLYDASQGIAWKFTKHLFDVQ